LAFADGDPHLWLDVANAIRYVENIRDALTEIDPPHAAGYRQRATAYSVELSELDAWIRETLSVVVPERRKIVVFHDSFQYFSRAYGFELTAAVLPASPSQQVSAAALVEVIEIVERERLPAVYREPQFSGQLLDVVARETGARVLTLHAALGAGVDGYAELMRANARALVEGLGP
jgi:zinc/manganese transport system substrate-binding protein